MENPYALIQVFGKGHLVSKAGAAVYVTRCKPVEVTPCIYTNCIMDIPASITGLNVFVDPLSLVLKSHAVVVK
jgi:hypothetical protein